MPVQASSSGDGSRRPPDDASATAGAAEERTIAIPRICTLVRCAYAWGGQAAFWAPIAGVSDDECDALVTGTGDWPESERILIGAVDELEPHRILIDGHVESVGTQPR